MLSLSFAAFIFGISPGSRINFIDDSSFEKTLRHDFLNSKGKLLNNNNEVELSPYAVVQIKPTGELNNRGKGPPQM